MIPKLLFPLWTTIAPAMGNHLWQSTLLAGAVALLTLALRNNRAQIRYGLWLTASVKFLIPFSLLAGLGSYLGAPRVSATPKTGLYFAIEQVGQPFSHPTIAQLPEATSSTIQQSLLLLLPSLLVIWLCGFAAVLIVWWVRWRRIAAVLRQATPLHEGREVQALRRLERLGNIFEPTAIFRSRWSLEPGIFGVAKPVLMWPQGLSERLEDEHLDAVLAHELLHIRRRDNLAAAIHMLVEAVFWFHPLVWWLGACLLNERERACDQAVLEAGGDRQVYAESILRVCKFCVGSPLVCVSGVTGADLKKRIILIMNERVARKLDFSRKLLLIAAALLAVCAPIAAGIFHSNPGGVVLRAQSSTPALPANAMVSITPDQSGSDRVALESGPDEFLSKNASLLQVLRVAYGVEDDRVSGAPAWLQSEKYDVEVREGFSGVDVLEERFAAQKRMLREILANRLKLALHRETHDLTVYALVVAQPGPKLHDSKPGNSNPNSRPNGIHFEGDQLVAQAVPMGALLFHLSRQLHRTLLDETGLSGVYDFTLKLPGEVPLGIDNPVPPGWYEPAVSAAIEQQLGLRLEAKTVPMEILVIDHVEKPAGN
jgi:bla regulator protein blaR1